MRSGRTLVLFKMLLHASSNQDVQHIFPWAKNCPLHALNCLRRKELRSSAVGFAPQQFLNAVNSTTTFVMFVTVCCICSSSLIIAKLEPFSCLNGPLNIIHDPKPSTVFAGRMESRLCGPDL